jgi:hypothetical protein
MNPARQRLGKQGLKAGIAAEVEVNFLGNGTQIPVSAATNINKRHSPDNKQDNRGHGYLY